ncbi:MAG: InlB B-repeat-containing protein, partial [Eubacterium sp.]|nr:InlB B-repeat-containing protein [Eubacterium sp.]
MRFKMVSRVTVRIAALLTAAVMILAMLPLIQAPVRAEGVVPEADVFYNTDNEWVGTLEISENKTVKISGITHDNNGTDYVAAIKIRNGANVNLVFEGQNVLAAGTKTSVYCAGIEVEEGATVNIYGLDGSSLTVTGGNRGAGIGGTGYGEPQVTNPKAGNINIYSGNITAIGGDQGSGIGSGRQSSCSDINIFGGNITALGTGGGAGIGTGYGTSGGSSEGAKVGVFNGGNITISGGTVKAAGYHIDFDNFDMYDPDTLYSEGFSDTFAAGIGGGYGASSGNIVIEGDADVTALGSCGGTAIGVGRGQSRVDRYDASAADCNVIIKGNSRVTAMTTRDRRETVTGESGGAAIGLSRGWGIENEPVGSVKIEGNANVYAYTDAGANAIGAGAVVGKFENTGGSVKYPPSSHLRTLEIGDDCTVIAISKGDIPERKAFDENFDLETLNAVDLRFDGLYFEDQAGFFTEDKSPIRFEVFSRSDNKACAAFALSYADTYSNLAHVGIHLPKGASGGMYIAPKDYEGPNGGKWLLTGPAESDAWLFESGANDIAGLIPEKYLITYHPNGGDSPEKQIYSTVDPEAAKLTVPTRDGYDFDGWFADEKLSGEKVTQIPAGSIGDKEFWAKWTEIPPEPVEPAEIGFVPSSMTAKGAAGFVIKWTKVTGAEGYDVFFAKCNSKESKTSLKLAKTIKGSKTLKWTKKGLKKKTGYKAVVKAWVMKDGKKTYIGEGETLHAYTSGGTKRYTNPKSVTVKKTKVTLAAGKSAKIKATVNKLSKKKALVPKSHGPKLRYASSNNAVAKVSKSGKITAVGKGTCKIFV